MNILVTGGAGYLGSVLLPKLIVRGHKVRVLDIGYFGVSHVKSLDPPVELIREDLRRVRDDAPFADQLLDGIDAVVHLAAISNDPSAELNPELTEEINFHSTIALAEAAKRRGARFVFSSSCSVYGEAPGELDENGEVNPLTVYAKSKVDSENSLAAMATLTWRPVVLRNGTLFGYSARMRFDLVINIFSLYSTLRNEVNVFGDGLQWRPFLHVADCARAFMHFCELKSPRHICYNISHQNLRVVDLLDTFKAINPRLEAKFVAVGDPDKRNYHVTTARMREDGFATIHSVGAGAEQIIEAIVTGLIPDPESIFYRNAKWLKELTQIGGRGHREVVQLMETISSVRYSTPRNR